MCNELTLEEYSVRYQYARFLTKTPGWAAASDETQTRIVESAKRLLLSETEAPEASRSKPLTSILHGYMHAIWLLMERDLDWLQALETEWWRRWAWYILRELHPGMMDEPEEPKRAILIMVFDRAGDQVRAEVEALVTSRESDTRQLLRALLDLLYSIPDPDLNTCLAARLAAREVPGDRVRLVAQFLLDRDHSLAEPACLALVNGATLARAEDGAVDAAIALMNVPTSRGWDSVMDLLERRPDLRWRILAGFAGCRSFRKQDGNAEQSGHLTCAQAGQLVRFLIEAFPPESDPQYAEAHHFGPDDEARLLRDHLVSWLGDQPSFEAVQALVALEEKFGARYPWLRRPRARAERLYRLSHWRPIPPRVVADLLAAENKRLIRSDVDAMDGIVTALEQYAHDLNHSSPSDLEDLWNRPRRGHPSPKEEERVSDKLCVAVRRYFEQYAVTADREVQIRRRVASTAAGGAPGSELDVLFRAPAPSVQSSDPITIPLEVKLAHNPESMTALREQLVNRYMSELGTSCGVYVVAWMRAPGCKPRWKSLECARTNLENQAKAAGAEVVGADIRVVVIDASLPLRSENFKSRRSPANGRRRGITEQNTQARTASNTSRSSRTNSPSRTRRKGK